MELIENIKYSWLIALTPYIFGVVTLLIWFVYVTKQLIILNFGSWNRSAKGGRLRRTYKRIYIKGYKWTPFVSVSFKWV